MINTQFFKLNEHNLDTEENIWFKERITYESEEEIGHFFFRVGKFDLFEFASWRFTCRQNSSSFQKVVPFFAFQLIYYTKSLFRAFTDS